MTRFSRRTLLAGLGGAAALLPFLPLLEAAGDDSFPKRIVLFFTPHGTVWDQWRPHRTADSFDLGSILAPLAPFKSKLNILDGLAVHDDGPGAPHTKGPALLWTGSPLSNEGVFTREDCAGGCTFGWNTGASFDQVLAQRFAHRTTYDSLELGVFSGGGHPGQSMIYTGPSAWVPARQDPTAAFDELFGASFTPAEEDRRRRHRRGVLGLVRGELNRVQPRVSRSDRFKIDAHLAGLSTLESQLLAPRPVCAAPGRPTGDMGFNSANLEWQLDAHSQLIASSFACDLTRIASIQLRVGENDGMHYDFLGVGEHHITTHDNSPEAQAQLTQIYTFYARRFAALLAKLDAMPEGDGTVLDHTMVIWGSEIGTGASHDFSRVPFVVAGGGGHGLRTGQYLELPSGTFHNRLLVSAMRFFGADDVNSFGSLDTHSGSLEGLGV